MLSGKERGNSVVFPGTSDNLPLHPVDMDARPIIPSIARGTRARDQSAIEILQVFQHLGYCIFYRAKEGFHNAGFWTVLYEIVVSTA